jgi:sugar phosphate isomerase/epimerase
MEGISMKQWNYALSTADEAPETAPILLKGTISENLIKAAAMGYQAIEVHIREDEEINFEDVKKVMKENNVKIAQIVTGRLNTEGKCSLIADEPYIQETAIAQMKQYIRIAAKLDANIVVGWVKGNIPAGKTRSKYMNRLAGNLKILSDYGKEKDVKINIEVINHYEVNVFTTVKELVEFLKQHDLANCYVHIDSYHMNIEESDPIEAIELAKGRIGYVHLADNQRWYPGSGQLNFQAILEALERVGYQGYLAIECFPYGNGEETARKALEYLKGLQWAAVL